MPRTPMLVVVLPCFSYHGDEVRNFAIERLRDIGFEADASAPLDFTIFQPFEFDEERLVKVLEALKIDRTITIFGVPGTIPEENIEKLRAHPWVLGIHWDIDFESRSVEMTYGGQ